ncbi:hypothetical protein V8D89_001216 [Ganoderma adspersum]
MDPSISETIETTLLHAVAALRRVRNNGRPVNKLPPEILSHVFSFLRYDGDELVNISREFGLHTTGEPVANLLPLLCISSRWRSIAMTSSFLWSMIDNREIFSLPISSHYRPVSGPLDAHIVETFFLPAQFDFRRNAHALQYFHQFNAALVDCLRNEGHRIREFFAEVPAVLLPALTDFPGESLRACELWPSEGSRDELGAIRPLFNASTPKLRSLVIGNILFIPSNHFPSLTHLLLVGGVVSPPPDGPFTFANFMLFLSRCPNLQILYLSYLDVVKLQELPDHRITAPLNLKYLRKFSNDKVYVDQTGRHGLPYSGPQFRRALLEHLELSPDCVIRLAAILPNDLGRTLHSIPFDKPFTSVYLGGHRHPEFYASEPNVIPLECFSIMATDARRQRGVRIDFQMPGSRYAPPDLAMPSARILVRDAMRHAPLLSSVQELWVVPQSAVLLAEPGSLFGGLPHLTTLVIGLLPLPQHLDVNVRFQWEPLHFLEIHDSRVVHCPMLHTLCVFITTAEHAMQVYSVVLSRGEAGYPVRRLVVGFYMRPPFTVLELAEGLWGLVEDFTLIKYWERCPDDLLWVHCLPPLCRDPSERNDSYWPVWM